MGREIREDTFGLGPVERALRLFAIVILGFLGVVLAYLVVWPVKLEAWPPPRHFLVMSVFMVFSLVICAALLFHFRRSLHASKIKLATVTYRNGLTGIYNERYIRERLGQEIDRAARYERPLSVMCADIDGLAEIGARLGRIRRGELIVKVSDWLASEMRTTDLLGRTGAGQFVAILTETGAAEAEGAAKRWLEAVRGEPFKLTRVQPISITLSFGLVVYKPDWQTPDKVIEAARGALAGAQKDGGNRLACA